MQTQIILRPSQLQHRTITITILFYSQGQPIEEFSVEGSSTQVELVDYIDGNYVIDIIADKQLITRKQFVMSK